MKILRVKKLPVFDVFTGEGWYNWARVLYDYKNSRLKVVKGENIPAFTKAEVEKQLKEICNG